MKIQWKFADGATSEVEVNEDLGEFITASRREEDSSERGHRRHCYSLDAILFEGKEYGTKQSPESTLINDDEKKRIHEAFAHLTETQQRRLLMLSERMSMQAIADAEGVNIRAIFESIELGRKKFLKFYQKHSMK